MASTQQSGFKRVWFITGASRGIGALIAEAALRWTKAPPG